MTVTKLSRRSTKVLVYIERKEPEFEKAKKVFGQPNGTYTNNRGKLIAYHWLLPENIVNKLSID